MGRFHLIDDKFREDPEHFLLQSSLAFVVVTAIVLVMGGAHPRRARRGARGKRVRRLRHAGAQDGVAVQLDRRTHPLHGGGFPLLDSVPTRPGGGYGISVGLRGAAAVSLGLLGMVVTDTEHPPAAGNVLAFAIAPIGLEHTLFTAGAVVFLSLVRYALRGWLKDLA